MLFSKAVKFSRSQKIVASPNFRRSQVKIKTILLLNILAISVTSIYPVSAHQVKTTADVGATLHIEPNDTPRAGEQAKTWFVLTRKGGEVIQLAECNCRLSVYAEPHASGEPPLLEPRLQPVTAERYKGVPGTEIIFPRPGAYQLQLLGKPTAGTDFKPFKLNFNVTVATGATTDTQKVQEVNQNITEGETRGVSIWAIAALGLVVMGVVLAVLQRRNRR